ncbi:MAG: alpha/beta hydrolase [Acidobacteriota bacterium]
MAKTSDQEIKQGRRRKIVRRVLFGSAALGLPVLLQSMVKRRARQLDPVVWGEPKELAAEDGKVLYQDLGSGSPGRPPIVLLHSFGPGHSGLHWRGVAEILGQRNRVIVPDLLGWGESDRPALRYDAELYVDLLRSILVDLLGEKAWVIASGRTASIAARVAATRSDLFAGLGMVAPRGLERRRDKPDLRDTLLHSVLRMPLFGDSALTAVNSRTAIAQHLRREIFHDAELAEARIDEHYRNSHLPGAGRALAAAVCGRLDLQLSQAELEGLSIPVWIAWGREAQSPSMTNADLWLRHLPSAELSLFDDAASHPHLEAPAAFAEGLESFLDR